MEELLKFLEENSVGSLATVDGHKPKVRPWGLMLADNDKFYFCTANTKNVYKQLIKNPSIEFTATSDDMITVRLSGEVIFEKDIAVKKKVLESNDMVKAFYEYPENPIFEVFYLEHGQAVISDFSDILGTTFSF